ncbi:MAG: hypothetical protein GC162_04560 [Planctomycetes bacterium]|nr:hypothetical protein [Planctomycetota bacterium]
MKPRLLHALVAAILLAMIQPAFAVDDAHKEKAAAVIAKAQAWLKAHQGEDGSWTPQPGPAVTALVVSGLLNNNEKPGDDAALQKGLKYILSRQKSDGGIYDEILANYNTSICLMALGRLPNEERVAPAVKKAQDFLRGLQWADGKKDPSGKEITEAHRWYGGAGYGDEGRPDMSNTATMIAGLHDSGLDCKDPAYIRAMEFISRLQGTKANTTFGEHIEPNGGFIYASSRFSNDLDNLETKVGTSENEKGEDVDNGAGVYTDAQGVKRLRTYGSMTYAGFMSYLYAQLDHDDIRVKDAFDWVQHNYTLDSNPGVGMQGYYYYLYLITRALSAYGQPTLTTTDGKTHDWANEIIDKLASLQKDDGSWHNSVDRWMERDDNLVTAYSVLALQYASGMSK